MESKQCSVCKKVKPLSQFNVDEHDKSGIRAQCKICQYKVQTKRYWEQHYKPTAKEIARTAYRQGKLQKPLCCEKCGEPKTLERHHPDYTKPMLVMWVCRKCHCSLKIA